MDSLTRRHSSAFSLMELLVAVSLFSVILLLAGLLLAGARSLYSAFYGTPADPRTGFLWIQDDLDHLLRHPDPERIPGFTLDNPGGLGWTRLEGAPDAERLPVEIHYRFVAEDAELLRMHRPVSREAAWTTNRVLRGVRRWDWRLETPEGPVTQWPPEGEDSARLPALLAAGWEMEDGEGETRFLIPAALRREPEAAGAAPGE